MAANETANRLHAAVKALGNGTIIARSAAIASVVRSAAGIYLVNLVPEFGIGTSEAAYDTALDGTLPGSVCVVQTSTILFSVFTFAGDGSDVDRQFNLKIWRMSSSAGL